jgi:hypothetical protein
MNPKRRGDALNKELLIVEKQEKKLQQAAGRAAPAAWKQELEKYIPAKVYSQLENAFCKGFALVFNQGRGLIDKCYNKEDLRENYMVRDYAVQVKGGRKQLRQMHRSAKQSDLLNLAVTTAEGVGLGVLGIGMPDIVLFLSVLLKSVYETAMNYGFDYESRREQMLILKMMETALSTGEDWVRNNEQVDALMVSQAEEISEEVFQDQQKAAASAFAMDMLILKFIQGIPVVGIVGGAANPVYFRKVMKYVQLKYRKRYLTRKCTPDMWNP